MASNSSFLEVALKSAKKVLVLAVGGGNDSVSSLLLQLQLGITCQYAPTQIDMAAMLPDCLDYHKLAATTHPLIGIITPQTTRSVQGKHINAFPEQILAQHLDEFPSLPVKTVYGLSMRKGSIGVYEALKYLAEYKNYDLILAVDVGGDFIACAENTEVLSPQMDGYAGYALKKLQKEIDVKFIYGVIGLGTDGESTPKMIGEALNKAARVNRLKVGNISPVVAEPFAAFYRSVVEPNRYSRTTDLTLKQIMGEPFSNPCLYRARFHVGSAGQTKKAAYYGTFEHYQDPAYFGSYVLFEDLSFVDNMFCQPCLNGVEWYLQVNKDGLRVNHELNGQSYMNLGTIYDNRALRSKSLFFGTPSNKFTQEQQIEIARDTAVALLSRVYDMAMIHSEYAYLMPSSLHVKKLTEHLTLVGNNQLDLDALTAQLGLTVKPVKNNLAIVPNTVTLTLNYVTLEENLEFIEEPYKSGCLKILRENRDLFEVTRGSTYNHQTWDGGYIDHVTDGLNYARHLYALDQAIGRPLPFSLSDALLVFYLHDLEKPWRIIKGSDGKAFNKPGLATKEEFKSFREQKLRDYGIALTPYLLNGLTYVEGELGDYDSTKRVMNELAAFCHKVDNWSARAWYNYPKQTGDEWPGATRFRTTPDFSKKDPI